MMTTGMRDDENGENYLTKNTVGVLTEVPVMLTLVRIANHTRHLF